MDRFDPYLEWLGIESGNRPPDHYQLLGLDRFEGDQQAIALAADQRMAEIRKFQTGPRGRHTQALLNQLATARFCLLDAQAKARYDEQLRQGSSHSVQPPDFAPGLVPPANLQPPAMSYGQSAAFQLPTTQLPAAPSPTAQLPVAQLPASHMLPDIPAPPPPPPPPPPRAASRPVSQPRTSLVGEGSLSRDRRTRVRRRDFGTNYLIALLLVCLGLAGVAWWVVQSGNASRRGLGRIESPPQARQSGPGKTGPSKAGPDNPLSPRQPKPPTDPSSDPLAPGRDPIDGPVVIEQEGSGVVNLPPAVAVLHGNSIQLGDQQQPDAITQWTSMEDWIEWHFRLVKPGVFRMMVRYAVDQDGVAGEFDVLVDGKVVRTCSLRAAGEGQSDVTDEYFIPLPRSGQHRLALRPASKPGTQLMRLFEIRLTPSSSSVEGS